MTSRRDFLRISTGLGAASIGASAFGKDDVYREMQRRLGFLAAPEGTPPDLLAHPSPPVDPWKPVTLSELRPPEGIPLFRMDDKITDKEACAVYKLTAADGACLVEEVATKSGKPVKDLAEPIWMRLFLFRFREAADKLAETGFRILSRMQMTGPCAATGSKMAG